MNECVVDDVVYDDDDDVSSTPSATVICVSV